MTDDLITLADAARRLKRSRQRVQQWVAEGRIPAVYIAGRPYIKKGDCKLPEPGQAGRPPQK